MLAAKTHFCLHCVAKITEAVFACELESALDIPACVIGIIGAGNKCIPCKENGESP